MFSGFRFSRSFLGLVLVMASPVLAQEGEDTPQPAAENANPAADEKKPDVEEPAPEVAPADPEAVPADPEAAAAKADSAVKPEQGVDDVRTENAALKKELAILKAAQAQALATEAAAKKAEDAKKAAEAAAKEAAGPHQGFNWSLKLGANASFLQSQRVVGQQDGLTLSAGGMVAGGALYLRGDHRWESKFNLQHMQTLTPLLPVPVKAVDLIDMSTEYRWALPFAQWVGLYARAQAVTAALPGQLVRNKDTQVTRNLNDGTTEDEFIPLDANGVSIVPLTGFLEPLVINENAGLNVLALEKSWLTIKTRLGAGGQHIIVQNGFVLGSSDDGSATLNQLGFSNSAGVNADFEAGGSVWKDTIGYSLVARFYYPVLTLEESDLDFVERVNADITGSLSFKVNDLMSVNYVLTIKRVPSILNDLQIQNALLLNFAFQVI